MKKKQIKKINATYKYIEKNATSMLQRLWRWRWIPDTNFLCKYLLIGYSSCPRVWLHCWIITGTIGCNTMKNFLLIVLLVCLFVAYVVEANARQALGEYIHVKLALTYLLSPICLELFILIYWSCYSVLPNPVYGEF